MIYGELIPTVRLLLPHNVIVRAFGLNFTILPAGLGDLLFDLRYHLSDSERDGANHRL